MSQLETISREIFAQVRTTIVLNMRFMDMAVFRLKPTAAPVTLATDGEYLYYHPLWLLKRYRAEANAVTRDYLHVLLHCVFRHPFVSTLVKPKSKPSVKPKNRHAVRLSKQPDRKRLGASSHK